jgi:hypothetical protein
LFFFALQDFGEEISAANTFIGVEVNLIFFGNGDMAGDEHGIPLFFK